jgi:hypothetical protein
VPLKRPRHFDFIAVFRSQKIDADQQQDDVSAIQISVDLLFPTITGNYLAIVPCLDQPSVLKNDEVFV